MTGNNPRPFRILSLDGGGIRGAFVAGFLANLEQKLDCRLADYFDLIAGTSTGAIIAAALALHEPASKIERFYRERGRAIFTRRAPAQLGGLLERFKSCLVNRYGKKLGIDYDNLLQSKYSADTVRSALSEVFGGTLLGEAKTRLIIPSVDLTRGQTIVFKTPHFPGLYRDRELRVVDILLASTAAPTYFPHAVIRSGSAYVDGGLWVNNPSVAAIAEVLKICAEANRPNVDFPIALESTYLLSVGTGCGSAFAKPPKDGGGILFWASHLLNVSGI